MHFEPVGNVERLSCPVCLDLFNDPIELVPCRHVLCRRCSAQLSTCPSCRQPITSSEPPNRIIANLAQEATVRCLRCQWEGPNERRSTHPCVGNLSAPANASSRTNQGGFRTNDTQSAPTAPQSSRSQPNQSCDRSDASCAAAPPREGAQVPNHTTPSLRTSTTPTSRQGGGYAAYADNNDITNDAPRARPVQKEHRCGGDAGAYTERTHAAAYNCDDAPHGGFPSPSQLGTGGHHPPSAVNDPSHQRNRNHDHSHAHLGHGYAAYGDSMTHSYHDDCRTFTTKQVHSVAPDPHHPNLVGHGNARKDAAGSPSGDTENASHVVLTLAHPLVASVTHPAAKAVLTGHSAWNSDDSRRINARHGSGFSVRSLSVIAPFVDLLSIFLPVPSGSSLIVVVALVSHDPNDDEAAMLAELTGPLRTTFQRTSSTEVVHVVEGCDDVLTSRRIVHATRSLGRVQLRGHVADTSFLQQPPTQSPAPSPFRGPAPPAYNPRTRTMSSQPTTDNSAQNPVVATQPETTLSPAFVVESTAAWRLSPSHTHRYQTVAMTVKHPQYDGTIAGTPFPCCDELDLSQLSSPALTLKKIAVSPRVIRMPRGGPSSGNMMDREALFRSTIERVMFHEDTQFTSIGASVMCFADNLTTVDLRGLKKMPAFGNHVFQGCRNITAVCMRGLPALESIGNFVFVNCGRLSFVDCRDCARLTKGSDRAFDGNAKSLCVLVSTAESHAAVCASIAPTDVGEASVILPKSQRARTRQPARPCCPVCEPNGMGLDSDLNNTALREANERTRAADSETCCLCTTQ